MISPVEELIEEVKKGRMVILVDDEDRENEGDLVIAAEKVTPEAINFMAKYGRGLICLSLTRKRAEELDLNLMASPEEALHGTAFTVSIDAAEGVSTGISAYDRAYTIKKVLDPSSGPKDFARPGHVFPLVARDGGVLERAGHTEASVDLMKLAGLYPAAVICEIMKDDGTMARLPDLVEFSKKHGIKIGTIADLIKYRMSRERLIKRETETRLITPHGTFKLIAYSNTVNRYVYMALVKEPLNEPVLVRVHHRCFLGETFLGRDCSCRMLLDFAFDAVGKNGGIIVYISDNEGREWECPREKYRKSSDGKAEFLRNYGIGAQVLKDLGVKSMRLITSHRKKVVGLKGFDLEIAETIIPEDLA